VRSGCAFSSIGSAHSSVRDERSHHADRLFPAPDGQRVIRRWV